MQYTALSLCDNLLWNLIILENRQLKPCQDVTNIPKVNILHAGEKSAAWHTNQKDVKITSKHLGVFKPPWQPKLNEFKKINRIFSLENVCNFLALCVIFASASQRLK